MAVTIRKSSQEGVRLECGKQTKFAATCLTRRVPTVAEKLRVTMKDGTQFIGTICSIHSSGAVGVRLSSGKVYEGISCKDNLVEVIGVD